MITKLKTCQSNINAYVPMTLSIPIAKFKFHQHQLRAVSPNLMLAKLTRYTVYILKHMTTKNIPVTRIL